MFELDRTERIAEGTYVQPSGIAGVDPIRKLVALAAPIGAAIAMWIHPHADHDVYASLSPVIDAWVVGHLLLFTSMSFLAVGLYLLLAGYRGAVATIARIGTATFAFLYLGYVAIVGLASGLVIREAQSLPAEQQAGVAAVVEYLHTEPLLFWAGALGAVGYLIAVTGIAIVYYRAGAPRIPLVGLVGSVVALAAHSGLGAIAGMALFFVSVVWLEFGWTIGERHERDSSTTNGRTGT
ncbi:hypothetical protein [Natronorubrum sp. FCH18a]|uniref:hypothetical protein n=1 Tax=Natronorubrum sp. FCH18a TaxID=3447018 RepID=UPI003F51871D